MTVEQLATLEALRLLKARYFRLVDTKQWSAWGDLFTEDAVFIVDWRVAPPGARDGGPEQHRVEGRAAIVEFASSRLAHHVSVHHGHMPEIELVSHDLARGVWAMDDIIDRDGEVFHGFGHYHETYRHEQDAWRIASLHLTRLRLENTPPPEA